MMIQYYFRAPELFEADATPSDSLAEYLHDSPGSAAMLPKWEKFTLWLKAQMIASGVEAEGPFPDEGHWIIHSNSGEGFAVCLVGGCDDNDHSRFHILYSEHNLNSSELRQVVKNILENSAEILDLRSTHH